MRSIWGLLSSAALGLAALDMFASQKGLAQFAALVAIYAAIKEVGSQ